MDNPVEKQYDEKGNAKHYDSRINVLTMIEHIWGTEAAMLFCEITEFKYRMRIGKKPKQPVDQEILKAHWYDRAAKYLQSKIDQGESLPAAPEGLPNMELILKKK